MRPISRSSGTGCTSTAQWINKAARSISISANVATVAAAKAFLRKDIVHHGTPQKITLDGYQASHRAVAELREDQVIPADTLLRNCQYLNNMIEQDHRGIKCRTGPMLGFKRFDHAAIVIAGIELARKITKGNSRFNESSPRQQKVPIYGRRCYARNPCRNEPVSVSTSCCTRTINTPILAFSRSTTWARSRTMHGRVCAS